MFIVAISLDFCSQDVKRPSAPILSTTGKLTLLDQSKKRCLTQYHGKMRLYRH
jgi:hypothetical protein